MTNKTNQESTKKEVRDRLKLIRAFLQGLGYNKSELDDANHYADEARMACVYFDMLQ